MHDDTFARLEERATERGYRDRLIGIGLALAADGETRVIGVGSADEAATRGIDETTVFRIGSVTKVFTALAVMQLVERGLASLDDPLSRYVASFAMQAEWRNPRPITLRHLLSHQAGVPGDLYRDFSFGPKPPAGWHRRFAELPQDIEGAHRTQPVQTSVAYSNLAYSLLALVVEAVSGGTFSDYLRIHILEPLGMRETSLYAEDHIASHLAEGNARDGLDLDALDHIRDLAAGAICASLGDMARFASMLAHEGSLPAALSGSEDPRVVLSQESFREMERQQNGENALDLDNPMGLGFRLEPLLNAEEGVVLSHGGDLPPYHAYLVAVPRRQVAVFGATHSNGGARTIAELAIEAAARLSGLEESARGGASVPAHTRGWRDEELDTLPGVYASPFGVLAVQRVRRRLRIRVFGSTLRMEPCGDKEYAVSYRMLGLIPADTPGLRRLRFVRREHDGATYLSLFQGAVFLGLGTRFAPVPIPESWMARVGKYEITNPGTYCVIEDPEILHVPAIPGLILRLHSLMNPVPLTFLLTFPSEMRARVAGHGRGLGDVLEASSEEGGDVLYFSGFRLRRTKG
ncbi:MAG: serine hydrolase [Spirochaetes bacterium]|jgi:CubicO group peptidase (beta-lactamase class C family)|nr:serine hydrolase [Spirochaetota bacterium]